MLFQRLHSSSKKHPIFNIIFHKKNEIFYSSRRYIFDKDFVKFLKENMENSVITASFSAVPRKKGDFVLTAELLTVPSKTKNKKIRVLIKTIH